jgi:hypothetical protein
VSIAHCSIGQKIILKNPSYIYYHADSYVDSSALCTLFSEIIIAVDTDTTISCSIGRQYRSMSSLEDSMSMVKTKESLDREYLLKGKYQCTSPLVTNLFRSAASNTERFFYSLRQHLS